MSEQSFTLIVAHPYILKQLVTFLLLHLLCFYNIKLQLKIVLFLLQPYHDSVLLSLKTSDVIHKVVILAQVGTENDLFTCKPLKIYSDHSTQKKVFRNLSW